MSIDQLQSGDMIYSKNDIFNDGSVPEMQEGALIAKKGSRGVLINKGHMEEDESLVIYLVRFEHHGELGPAIGCWPEELTDEV